MFAAFRFGNGEAVQGLFPVLFVFLFLSSMALPRPLIEQDWFRTIATYNPVSYLLEGIRSLFIVGFDGEALALAFGCALGHRGAVPRARRGQRAHTGWCARERSAASRWRWPGATSTTSS